MPLTRPSNEYIISCTALAISLIVIVIIIAMQVKPSRNLTTGQVSHLQKLHAHTKVDDNGTLIVKSFSDKFNSYNPEPLRIAIDSKNCSVADGDLRTRSVKSESISWHRKIHCSRWKVGGRTHDRRIRYYVFQSTPRECRGFGQPDSLREQ